MYIKNFMVESDKILKNIFDNSNPNYCKIDITPHEGTSMRFSRDKSYIVFGTRAGNVVAYNQLTQTIDKVVNASVNSLWDLSLSNDSTFILAVGEDNEIKYLTFPEMELREPLTGHTRNITHIIICDSNTECYSASDDGSVRFWDIPGRTGSIKYSHNGVVNALDMSTDEKFLLSGAGDGSIILFDIAQNAIKWTRRQSRGVWCAKITNHMNYAVTGDWGYVRFMTFQGDLIRYIKQKHETKIRWIEFATDEKFFVTCGNNNYIKIWEVDTSREEITLDYHTSWAKAVVIDMENKTVTSIGDDCAIYIAKIPEFNTNLYLPDEFTKDKVLYFCETNCFYTIKSEILYVCTAVGLEIVNKIKIKEMNGVKKLAIGKSLGKICVVLSELILTIDIFTYEIKSFSISADVKLELCEQYILAIASDEVSVLSTQSLELLGSHQIKDIDLAESFGNRIFLSNKKKIFEVNTEQVVFEYNVPGIKLMRVLSNDKILTISLERKLYIFSLTSTRYLIYTTTLEDTPIHVFTANQRFFLIYDNIIKVYSSENYLQVSQLTTTIDILGITLIDADTLICCGNDYATLVKCLHAPVDSSSIAWTSSPYKSEIIDDSDPHYSAISIAPYRGTSMRTSNDRSRIVFTTRSGHVVIYNHSSRSIENSFQASGSSLWNLCLSPDNAFVLAGGVDHEIKFLSFPDLSPSAPLLGHTGDVNHIIIAKSGHIAYSASNDCTVKLWKVHCRTCTTLYSHSALVNALDLSSDEKIVASGDGKGAVICYDVSQRSQKWNRKIAHGIWSIAVHNNGRSVIAGDHRGAIHIWNLRGDFVRSIVGKHKDRVRCLAFSCDEKLLVSSGNDHVVKVWKVENWKEEHSFDLHTNWVKAVAIDLERKTVTSIGDDQKIFVSNL